MSPFASSATQTSSPCSETRLRTLPHPARHSRSRFLVSSENASSVPGGTSTSLSEDSESRSAYDIDGVFSIRCLIGYTHMSMPTYSQLATVDTAPATGLICNHAQILAPPYCRKLTTPNGYQGGTRLLARAT
ncbi:hypothetical protein KL938_003801 [Ogataea parapolymorpha]|nr:hypothetical protein KL938_003801 [Ogataea parapolymorpha]